MNGETLKTTHASGLFQPEQPDIIDTMKTFPRLKQLGSISLLAVFMLEARLLAQTNGPTEWIDPDTGHRVVQLSREPGSESLYFNLNPFTPDGRKMVITSPTGISLIDLQTHEVEKIVPGRLHIIMVGHKTGQIYYVATKTENGATNRWVCSIDPNTKAVREIMKLPRGQEVSTVNADETLLCGTITERNDWATNAYFDGGPNRLTDVQTAESRRGTKGQMMEDRLAKHYPMQLFSTTLPPARRKPAIAAPIGSGTCSFPPPTRTCSCSATKAPGIRSIASGPFTATARA